MTMQLSIEPLRTMARILNANLCMSNNGELYFVVDKKRKLVLAWIDADGYYVDHERWALDEREAFRRAHPDLVGVMEYVESPNGDSGYYARYS